MDGRVVKANLIHIFMVFGDTWCLQSVKVSYIAPSPFFFFWVKFFICSQQKSKEAQRLPV